MTTTKEKIVLTDKLIVSSRGKLCDRYYRAVLIEDDKDVISVEQPFKDGSWGPTGGSWYAETLLGLDEYGTSDDPSDSLYIDGGAEWLIEGGMLIALNAYKKLGEEREAS